MKKRVLSLFLAITLCLTLTPTGALAEELLPEQTVSVTQEAQIPAPALEEKEKEEEKTTPAENGAGENAPPANPEENPTENAPAAAEKNTADGETDKEAAAATGRDEPKADGSPSDDDAAKVQNQLVMAAAAGPGEPTMMGQNNLLALADEGQTPANAQNSEGGGIYVAPGSPTEGGGGTYIPGEDTRTEIWCVSKPDSIGRSYDGTTDGGTISIDLTFTDGTNEIKLKEGTGFTAKKTFESADAGWHTVTVEIALSGDAAAKYKLKAGEETFTIGGYINKAHPKLNVSLSRTTCTVGEKILSLLSVEGAPEGAAVTYYYTPLDSGYSEFEGSNAVPEINENTAISEPGTYYVYAKTGETKNYEEERSTTAELTVNKAVVEAASVTHANGTDGGTYESLPAALNAAQDGDTVKLLADHVTDVDALNGLGEDFTFEQYVSIVPVVTKTLTLDLNHKTVDYLEVGFTETNAETQEKETLETGNLTVTGEAAYGRILNLEFMDGALDIQSGEVGGSEGAGLLCDVNSGTATISGGTVLGLTVLEGAAVTVNGGSAHAGTWSNDGTLNITGGTFGNVWFLNNGGTIAISGGTFGTITNTNGSGSIPLMPLLADNYAFYQGDNAQNSTEETLTNVTVRSHTHSVENGKCDCGASYVASVTSDAKSTNYTSLDDALDAAQDGDTVTLIGDAEVTKWHSLSKAFTLELNGKTVTTQSKAELYLYARVIVQDSSTGKTGGMAGTALLNVQEGGDLIIKSGIFNGRIAINVGKLTIKGGTFNQEVDLCRGDSDSVFFSGGTFAKIWYPNSSGSFLDLLADGCAFYDNDGNLVNAAEISGTFLYNVQVQQHTHSFTDGACACGYTCPHTSVNENGVCEICNKQFAASITEGNDVTYYDTLDGALVYATRNNGCTLKLLADVTNPVSINTPFIFDLNGHNFNKLSVGARAKIRDSSTTKGTIKELKVFNMTDADYNETVLTVADLLEEGYAFKSSSGNKWYFGVENAITNVTVQPAPIKSVTAEHPTVTVEYGKTSGVTLTATAVLATEGGTVSYQWYKIGGTDFPIQDATESTYQLPADLGAGTHTYRLTATSDGYPKSVDITVKVTPISLEDATVTVKDLTYNGQKQFPTVTVKLGETTLTKNTDFDVNATMQTNAGSYKLTISGNGNYSGKIEDVEWKIEPMKIDSVMVSSDISKVYDGTAEINMSANEWATALKFKTRSAYDVVSVPSDAYTISDAYFVEKSGEETIYSPDAGVKYGISFKITLKSNNYVLQTYGEDTPSTSKEITQSGGAKFTIRQANVTSPGEITQLVFNDLAKTYTIDLAKLLPKLSEGCAYGSIQYQGHNYNFTDNAYLDSNNGMSVSKEGILTLPTVSAHTSDVNTQIGTITVPVVTTNYQNFEFTIKVYISERIPLNASGVTVSASEITYGQTLNESKLTATGTMKHPGTGEEVKGTFAWTNPETKPGAAGDYTASWTFTPAEGYEEYAPATGNVTVKVNKADPTFTAPAAKTLTYTGSEQTLLTAGSTQDGTMMYRLGESGEFVDSIPNGKDAGTYTVCYKVVGDGNHNDTEVQFVSVTIKPMELLRFVSTPSVTKTYDGTAVAPLSEDAVTFNSRNASKLSLPKGAYSITNARFTMKQTDGSYADSPEVGNGKSLSFTVTLTSDNYVFESTTEDSKTIVCDIATDDVNRFTITKAAAPTDIQTGTLNIINGTYQEYSYDFTKLLPELSEGEYGTISYGNQAAISLDQSGYGYDETTVEFNNGVLILAHFSAMEGKMIGQIGTVNVTVTTTNYEDFQLTLVLNAVNQIDPEPNGTITASNITYGQALSDSSITGKMKDPNTGATVNGTFTWTDGTIKPAANDSYKAEWTFTPDAPEYATVTGTVTVTVNPKAVTVSGITAKDKVYDGNTDAVLDYSEVTLDGVLGNDTLTVTATGTFESADVGEQKVIISGFKLDGDSAANYVPATEGSQRETTATITAKQITVSITPNGGTYGSVIAAAAVLSGVVDGETVPVTLTYTGNGYNSTTVPTNAGSYTVTASIADSNYVLTGKTTANFVIGPKSIKDAKVVLGKGLIANGAEQTQTVEKVLLYDKEIPADSYTVTDNTATAPGKYTLTITAKGNYTGTVVQTYAIAPAKAEDAPGAEIVIGSGKVKVVVKSEGAVPPAALLTDKAELLAMLVDSGDITADELVQVADGASVDIALTVKEANVSAEIKTAMAQAAKGCTIGQYLDISLFKYMTVNGSQQAGVPLRTTKNALMISVVVPDALINTNSAVNRTYCIVRRHDGAITVLDAAFDAASKTLTFKTDRFSDYAIAYKDTTVPSSGSNPGSNNSSNDSEAKKNEVAAPTPAPTSASTSKPSTITAMPQTGDTSNPTLYVVLLVASLLGLAVVFVCKKRNDK